MRKLAFLLVLAAGCAVEPDARAVHRAALSDQRAVERLRELCDDIGHRLSGSPGLDRAIQWAVETLREDGHENVRAEKAMVPRWVRGRESLEMIEPVPRAMTLLGLGGSVGTPPEGITAEVVVAPDRAELGDATGKIVLFNRAMPPYDPVRGSGYGETVAYRVQGPTWAAEKGAVAVLVRSVTARSLYTPHTGMLSYGSDRKIPAAAVTIEDAEIIARLAARGKRVVVRLKMEARDEGLVESANVVAELVGREHPEEIVLLSGHLDSWDVGQGAHDDGGGCVAAMEALGVLRRLGRPRRTVRVVLWTNEENGMAGVKAYLEQHKAEIGRHVAAIESDSGVFRPLGFHVDHRDAGRLRRAADDLRRILAPLGLDVRPGGSAPDVGHFKPHGVPCLGLRVEGSTYFDYHHTWSDTFDKVNPEELSQCVAAMAALAWALAEREQPLGGP